VGFNSPAPAATASTPEARLPLRKVLRVMGFTEVLLGLWLS
jgi:hypothetical protein